MKTQTIYQSHYTTNIVPFHSFIVVEFIHLNMSLVSFDYCEHYYQKVRDVADERTTVRNKYNKKWVDCEKLINKLEKTEKYSVEWENIVISICGMEKNMGEIFEQHNECDRKIYALYEEHKQVMQMDPNTYTCYELCMLYNLKKQLCGECLHHFPTIWGEDTHYVTNILVYRKLRQLSPFISKIATITTVVTIVATVIACFRNRNNSD